MFEKLMDPQNRMEEISMSEITINPSLDNLVLRLRSIFSIIIIPTKSLFRPKYALLESTITIEPSALYDSKASTLFFKISNILAEEI